MSLINAASGKSLTANATMYQTTHKYILSTISHSLRILLLYCVRRCRLLPRLQDETKVELKVKVTCTASVIVWPLSATLVVVSGCAVVYHNGPPQGAVPVVPIWAWSQAASLYKFSVQCYFLKLSYWVITYDLIDMCSNPCGTPGTRCCDNIGTRVEDDVPEIWTKSTLAVTTKIAAGVFYGPETLIIEAACRRTMSI